MKVVVIGGGPAGMMAAITSAEKNNEVIIIEKMKTLGRKLLITGKGRCNITSSLPIEEFIQNIPGNGKFLYSAFQTFSNKDIMNFMEKQGVKIKEERGNRIFPVSDKSMDVLAAFEKKIKELKIKVYTGMRVSKIIVESDASIATSGEASGKVSGETSVEAFTEDKEKVVGVEIENGKKILCDKVILATGGKSYPLTGSTGDGYKIASQLGHTITKIKPSLVPLEVSEKDLKIAKQLQGLSLRNVGIKFVNKQKNKVFYEDFGEMLFTHFGVSGPTILSASAHLWKVKNVEEEMKNGNIQLQIDLKPALSQEKLDLRIRRDFEQEKNKAFKNSLNDLLPGKMIDIIVKLSKINENKKVNEITKEERLGLVRLLKNFSLEISKTRPVEEAIVTSGGVSIKEINPKTMESKIVKGLYFAGEVIDVDAYTGGFNLQIAYSTGVVAGATNE